MRSSCVYRLCQSQVPRCHDPILQHEPNGRHRISIDPRLLDFDAIWTTIVLHVPEPERCFHDGTPFLALIVRNCAFYVLESDVSLRVTNHGPTITFFPVVPALVIIYLLLKNEYIKHLFFDCKFARSVWAIVQIASNLYPPRSVRNMFGNWLRGIDKQFSKHIAGAAALCWALWLTRNDIVFNHKSVSSPMQVIHICSRWLRMWSILQRPEDRDFFMMASTRLECSARDIFYPHGWRCDLRIGPASP